VCFVYVAYDLCGDFPWLYDEVTYSILSLAAAHGWHCLPSEARVRVFSDHRDRLRMVADEVEIEPLDRHRIAVGMGRQRFIHRLKLSLLIDVLAGSPDPVLYLDGDTVIRGSLHDSLSWLAPGHSLMHCREGPVGDCVGGPRQNLAGQLATLAKQGFDVTPDSPMFNAGAVGIHPADGELLGTALAFTDDALALGQRHIWEQLGISIALAAGTRIRTLDSTVAHYWYARRAHHRPISAELDEMTQKELRFSDAVEHVRRHPLQIVPPRRLGIATRVWLRLTGRSRSPSLRIQDRIAGMADWQD
jgi:hypothetical protein